MFPLYLSARYNLDKRLNSFEAYYKRAVEIAEVVSSIEGITLIPKVPQTNMFHMHIKGEKLTLVERALEISRNTGIWGLNHFESIENGYCKLEWYIGDATMDIPLNSIKEIVVKMTGK